MNINWTNCSDIFHRDGSLRDLYVLNTTAKDWQVLLSYLVGSEYKLKYTRDGNEELIPNDVESLLMDKAYAHNLEIDINRIKVNCHFFSEEEIELDVDPKEVTSQSNLNAIVEFMSNVGAALQKDVTLTEENSQDYVWLKYFADIAQIKRIEST